MSERIHQSVSLTPERGRFVRARVDSGRCQSASEVIRDSLRLLQERNTALSRLSSSADAPESGDGR